MSNGNVTLEQLALYQDQLLSDREMREVETILAERPEYRSQLDELRMTHAALQEWGLKDRILNGVLHELQNTKQAEPEEKTLPWFIPNFQTAIAFAVIFMLALAADFFIDSLDNQNASVLKAVGTVEMANAREISNGVSIKMGDTLVVDKNSYLALRMGDGKSLAEAGAETVATLTGARSLRIEKGVVWNEVAKEDGESYRITTPHGTVTVLGTKFEVEVEESKTVVKVAEGKVEISSHLSNASGETVYLSKGMMGSIHHTSVSAPTPVALESIAAWKNRYHNRGGVIDTRGIRNALSVTQ